MTILVASIGPDSIFVAADGQGLMSEWVPPGTLPVVPIRVEKWVQVPDRPLMWGTCGSTSLRREFSDWIETTPTESWEKFTLALAAKVAELNGLIRSRAEKAKSVPRMELFSVIIAGYIEGRAEILTVDEDGQSQNQRDMHPVVHGPYGPTFVFFQRILGNIAPTLHLDDPESLRAFLEVFVATAADLFSPVDAWRITKAGCERL